MAESGSEPTGSDFKAVLSCPPVSQGLTSALTVCVCQEEGLGLLVAFFEQLYGPDSPAPPHVWAVLAFGETAGSSLDL